MYKKIFIITIIMFSFMLVIPKNVEAFSINELSNSIYILDGENTGLEGMFDDYDQTQECEGDNSILGNVNDPDSVAWLLQQILNFIKVGGPMLVVILSSIDFIKVIVNSDDDAMRKAFTKLWQRLILAALLFFIPVLVEAMLDVFGLTSNSTCGLS